MPGSSIAQSLAREPSWGYLQRECDQYSSKLDQARIFHLCLFVSERKNSHGIFFSRRFRCGNILSAPWRLQESYQDLSPALRYLHVTWESIYEVSRTSQAWIRWYFGGNSSNKYASIQQVSVVCGRLWFLLQVFQMCILNDSSRGYSKCVHCLIPLAGIPSVYTV